MILDVRTQEEFAVGHVPGAVLVPHDQLEKRIAELGAPLPVVVCCKSGRRAGIAEKVLAQHGFSVTLLDGSWQAWQAAKLPEAVISSAAVTSGASVALELLSRAAIPCFLLR